MEQRYSWFEKYYGKTLQPPPPFRGGDFKPFNAKIHCTEPINMRVIDGGLLCHYCRSESGSRSMSIWACKYCGREILAASHKDEDGNVKQCTLVEHIREKLFSGKRIGVVCRERRTQREIFEAFQQFSINTEWGTRGFHFKFLFQNGASLRCYKLDWRYRIVFFCTISYEYWDVLYAPRGTFVEFWEYMHENLVNNGTMFSFASSHEIRQRTNLIYGKPNAKGIRKRKKNKVLWDPDKDRSLRQWGSRLQRKQGKELQRVKRNLRNAKMREEKL